MLAATTIAVSWLEIPECLIKNIETESRSFHR